MNTVLGRVGYYYHEYSRRSVARRNGNKNAVRIARQGKHNSSGSSNSLLTGKHNWPDRQSSLATGGISSRQTNKSDRANKRGRQLALSGARRRYLRLERSAAVVLRGDGGFPDPFHGRHGAHMNGVLAHYSIIFERMMPPAVFGYCDHHPIIVFFPAPSSQPQVRKSTGRGWPINCGPRCREGGDIQSRESSQILRGQIERPRADIEHPPNTSSSPVGYTKEASTQADRSSQSNQIR